MTRSGHTQSYGAVGARTLLLSDDTDFVAKATLNTDPGAVLQQKPEVSYNHVAAPQVGWDHHNPGVP